MVENTAGEEAAVERVCQGVQNKTPESLSRLVKAERR